MLTTATIEQFNTLLAQAGIPAHEIKVFGRINVNIHITCESRETAARWERVVRKFCSRVRIIETTIEAARNLGTMLSPTRRRAFRVSAVV